MYFRASLLVLVLAVAATSPTGSTTTPVDPSPLTGFTGWLEALELDPEVPAQIERYSAEEEDLGPGYAQTAAANVRALILNDVKRALVRLETAPSETAVEVSFLEPGFASPGGAEPDLESRRDFEEGFIRTEAFVFLEGVDATPAEALRVYTDPSFRMDLSSRIERIWTEDGLSCVEVKGVPALLSPTLACNRIDEFVRRDVASQHSQVVSNPGGDDYQTVYFKESLKTFVAVPGGIVLYYINYTRAVKLGAIKRAVGRGKIEDSEADKIRELRSRLLNASE